MKIFSKHRKKIEAYRRFGSREFQDKLESAKNYKRGSGLASASKPKLSFYERTGLSGLAVISVTIFVGVIFYFLVVSPYFLVKQITVTGNKQISAGEISSLISDLGKKRYFLVPENSLVMLSQGQVNSLFAKNLPEISSAQIRRSWPDKISIKITERTPAMVLTVGVKSYLIDDQGFVVKQIDDPGKYFQVQDTVNEDIPPASLIDGKIIPFIVSMQKAWPGKISVPISEVKVPGKGATEVEFVSVEGWSAFFSTDRPVANQLVDLYAILNKLVTPANRLKLAYVDLRLSKWAYYCFKDTPCQQTDSNNIANTAIPQVQAQTSGSSQAQQNAAVTKPQ